MKEPIKQWKELKKGYRFKERTFYNSAHIGLDVIAPEGTPIFAWQDLEVISSVFGRDGGNTIFVKCPNNKRLFRLMHLQFSILPGKYKEGQILAQVGNTGRLTTGAHLHLDISKDGNLKLNDINNFEDPEIYFNWILSL
jgi:murein DD-endopeptidase MepM/ murein hydrolase activator NlpD